MSPHIIKALVRFLMELGYSKKELFAMTEEEIANLAWLETANFLKS